MCRPVYFQYKYKMFRLVYRETEKKCEDQYTDTGKLQWANWYNGKHYIDKTGILANTD